MCPGCDSAREEGELQLCAGCVRGLVPLRAQGRTRTVFSYETTAAELIRRLKFEGRRDGLPILVAGLAARVSELEFASVVPVPRHWRRIRKEGCDPVWDLARGLAHATERPLRAAILRRPRPVPPQTELDPAARRRNAAGSFRARPGALRGGTVLLLDDVTTTGATLRAAAAELRSRAGARRVIRLAVAGTPALPPAG